MTKRLSVATTSKDTTFQVRINSEIKKTVIIGARVGKQRRIIWLNGE